MKCSACNGLGLGKSFSDWYLPCKECNGWGFKEVIENESNEKSKNVY
jgi:excinuclease UvrABC ATPase subunit